MAFCLQLEEEEEELDVADETSITDLDGEQLLQWKLPKSAAEEEDEEKKANFGD